jgi:hypothetical protein
MTARIDRRWLLPALLALTAGCSNRPNAPALQDEPIYHNPQEGFRFTVPDNWKMRSRGEMPRGPLTQERLLVEYRRTQAGATASLIVLMGDVPEPTELPEHLTERAVKSGSGLHIGEVEALEVGGQPAVRAVFENKQGGEAFLTEVVAVRRGGRVYYFTGVFPSTDRKSREQVRNAVASVTW